MNEEQLREKLQKLRSLPGEAETVEFKEAKSGYDFHKIGKYFSALSNEANIKVKNESWLIFGVRNKDREIVGSNYRAGNRPYLDSLKNEIGEKTTGRITFVEIFELTMPEGRVVMFHIPPAPQGIPVAWEGHYYGRDGESLRPLNIEEIERIRRQVTNYDWSGEICSGATFNDLDADAIRIARESFKKKNPRLADETNSWNNLTFLNNARITIDSQITRTAVLLLGKPESAHHIAPAIAQITWTLRDKDAVEKDYEHFYCPFVKAVDQVFAKIRNLKYRYLKQGTLFPEEIDQYEPLNIKEALSNCIAHQDYTLDGRITVTESEDGYLTFVNPGSFLPGSIEKVLHSQNPPSYYRNQFLTQAMLKLNMIDTVGGGIKRMFRLQRERFFPLPEYDLSDNLVRVVLIGKMLNPEYARVLALNPDLSLEEIILLDKVQKKKELTKDEAHHLKERRLIEGRKPNYHISASIAKTTGQSTDYMRLKGVDDQFIRKMIIEHLDKFGETKKIAFEKVMLSKISDNLTEQQKKNKIRNILQDLKRKGKIINKGKIWTINP
ncbi:MAG: transcriptional regulator [Candidatus Marinimicrobia bacterium CG08_land_8_20_14_0_20_45_22]|nr:MAG: transcriptional regulator [Candidatus Marinimicrobia bacterium CG08_land_8_20_14_0_20_45_22]